MKINRKEPEKGKEKETSTVQEDRFTPGVHKIVDGATFLPPGVQAQLSALGKKYGLPFDLGRADLTGNMAQNVRALRKIAELAETNSKLLPELIKLARKLFRAEINEAKYYVQATKLGTAHQAKIDKYSADIFLNLVQHELTSKTLEYRTNQKRELLDAKYEAWREYHQGTIHGDAMRRIEAEIENQTFNHRLRGETRQVKQQGNQERKQKLQKYYNSAFAESEGEPDGQ